MLDTSGKHLVNALKARPFGLHLNIEETKIISKKGDWQSAIECLSKYCELIAITLGEEGLYLAYRNEIIHGSVKIAPEFSSVGSGDCLIAGIAWALERNMSPEEIVKWGVACGAANCMRQEIGMFYKRDVEVLLNQVKIKEVSV